MNYEGIVYFFVLNRQETWFDFNKTLNTLPSLK